ncbi:MAG: glycosyltransferase family 4 protein [Candidatus Diapherotrites archaeon]|nr:glycosyltransferase family 4 protein [Candidatus Diapherotrites archaeon]
MSGEKICRIVDSFPTGKEILGDLGPNFYYYAKGTTAAGFEEYIICKRKIGQPEKEVIEGINVWRVSPQVPHSRRDQLWGEFGKKSLDAVKEIKPAIVHGHNSFHYYIAHHKKDLAIQGTKLVTHFHGDLGSYAYRDKLPLSFDFKAATRSRFTDFTSYLEWKSVAKPADMIIACDKFTRDSVLRIFSHLPVEVVYNGVDFEKFKYTENNLKEEMSAEYLLMDIARPVPWKGIQYLIKGVKELNKEFSGIKCIVLGAKRNDAYDINYRWLESLRRKEGVDNVELCSNVPYFDLPKYYSATDCYQAQACNTPISATNGGGIPEIFGPKSGLLFEPRNVKDLVEKTAFILKNPKNFRGGREVIEEKATWDTCVKSMIDSYKKLLG